MPRTPCGCRDAGEGGKGEDGELGPCCQRGPHPSALRKTTVSMISEISPCLSNSIREPGQQLREQQTFVGCRERGRRQVPDGGEKEAREELLCWEMEEGGVKSNIVFQESFAAFQTDLGCAPWLSTPMRQG